MANPRKPTDLKLVAGTTRKDRSNPTEPKPDKVAPVCPAHMSDECKVYWGRVCVELEMMGVLTRADGIALEQLVYLYQESVTLKGILAKEGRTYQVKATNGEVVWKKHPAADMLKDILVELRHSRSEFGLSPASRTKVHTVPTGGNKNPAEAPKQPASAYLT